MLCAREKRKMKKEKKTKNYILNNTVPYSASASAGASIPPHHVISSDSASSPPQHFPHRCYGIYSVTALELATFALLDATYGAFLAVIH